MKKTHYSQIRVIRYPSTPIGVTEHSRLNAFNSKKEPFETIGDRLLLSFKYGADVGPTITPKYDSADDNGNVDVLASPDHDFFDIAEQFGKLVPQQSTVLRSTEESSDIDA